MPPLHLSNFERESLPHRPLHSSPSISPIFTRSLNYQISPILLAGEEKKREKKKKSIQGTDLSDT